MRTEALKKAQKKYYANHKEEIYRKQACGILKKHHEELKDDPERLSTNFILELIKS